MDVVLNFWQGVHVFFAGKADGGAGSTGACGTTDAVHVVFGDLRQVVVKDVCNIRDVQAARGDVGGDDDVDGTALKVFDDFFAFFLRDVTGEGGIRIAVCFQHDGEAFEVALGVEEDHAARRFFFIEQANKQRRFFVLGGVVEALRDVVGGAMLAFYADGFRRIEVFVGEFAHFFRHRRREKQIEAFVCRRHLPQQVAHVVNKAEVEHAVSFV